MGLFSLLMLTIASSAVLERSRLEFGFRGAAYQRRAIRFRKRHEFAPQQITEIKDRQIADRLAEEISTAVGLSDPRASQIALESELPADLR